MKITLDLTSRQVEILRDLLEERLEDLDEDIAHYGAHPEELDAQNEPGEEPLAIEDYEHYRDEVRSLLSHLPEAED